MDAPTVSTSIVETTRTKLIAAINARDVKTVEALLGVEMRKVLSPDKLEKWLPGILDAKGKLGDATTLPNEPVGARRASYAVRAERGVWRLDLVVDHDGRILGLKFGEPPAADPPVATSTLSGIDFALPFKGEWKVVWGGPSEDVNQHVRMKSQRRAADLYMVDSEGKSHKGEGKDLRDYYAYGKEVLAAADGKVVYAIDGVPDSALGVLNGYALIGNAVVLEHKAKTGPSLFTMVAHLVAGSVKVKPGALVKKGQPLGLCGNSGNSSEPHLHFQLMDGARAESSFGVEAVFAVATVTRKGERASMKDYTFLKDDRVSPASSTTMHELAGQVHRTP